jgi:hypothetical protein
VWPADRCRGAGGLSRGARSCDGGKRTFPQRPLEQPATGLRPGGEDAACRAEFRLADWRGVREGWVLPLGRGDGGKCEPPRINPWNSLPPGYDPVVRMLRVGPSASRGKEVAPATGGCRPLGCGDGGKCEPLRSDLWNVRMLRVGRSSGLRTGAARATGGRCPRGRGDGGKCEPPRINPWNVRMLRVEPSFGGRTSPVRRWVGAARSAAAMAANANLSASTYGT